MTTPDPDDTTPENCATKGSPLTSKSPLVRRAGRIGLSVTALALLAYVVRLALTPAPNAGFPAPAPRFTAMTIDATPVARTLGDYAGQALLVNIWATWCDPCREEMPSLQRLHEAYRDRGLRVVAISVDEAGSDELIREYVKEQGLTFEILHDAKSDVMGQFGVPGVPETFLISRTGMIVGSRFVRDWASAESRALVDSLLLAPSR